MNRVSTPWFLAGGAGLFLLIFMMFTYVKNQQNTILNSLNSSPTLQTRAPVNGLFKENRQQVISAQEFEPQKINQNVDPNFDYKTAMKDMIDKNTPADDPKLIQTIRNYYIKQPSTEPYNLDIPNRLEYSNGQTPFIDSRLNYIEGGFYVECGALNGEKGSNSLFFEKVRKWNGLLIEADPSNYDKLKTKHRKAFSVNACLSPRTTPAKVLEMAFDEYARAPTPEMPAPEMPAPATPTVLQNLPTPATEPASMVHMVNKKVQVCLRPPQRTRSHQTDTALTTGIQTVPTSHTIRTQTDHVTFPDDKLTSLDNDDNDDSSDDEYDPLEDDISTDEEHGEDDEPETIEMNYILSSTASPIDEKQFLVSESALRKLLGVCRYCSSATTPVIRHTRGTLIVTDSVCVNGHVSIWRSQSCHNSLPWSNLLTATAIMCSGSNSSTAMRLFKHMNLQMFSTRTCTRLQSMYVSPAATDTWDAEQASLLQDLHGQDVIVGGDARCDSPGYSAKYGSYTIMDLQTSKILDFQLVQLTFNKAFNRGRIVHDQSAKDWIKRQRIASDPVEIECFPFYSFMLALNRTTIDFFSLDVEGDELNVLKTIPFDKLNIKMLAVEYVHETGGHNELQRFMEGRGYDTLLKMQRDDGGVNDLIFRKKGLTH